MRLKAQNLSFFTKAYSLTWNTLRKYPSIIIPFLIFAASESFLFIVFYLAPRKPFIFLLGPIIRTFWGEAFLHYPLNFLLLPTIDNLIRMILSVTLGSLLTGAALALVLGVNQKQAVRLKKAVKSAFNLYASLFAVILVTVLVFYGANKLLLFVFKKYFITGHSRLLFIPARFWVESILPVVIISVGIIVQAFFVYVLPVLVFEKERLLKAFLKGIVFFKNHCLQTLLLVAVPMILYIPIIILRQSPAFLIEKIFPESVLIVTLIGILINSLILDFLITVSTAFYYLNNRKTGG